MRRLRIGGGVLIIRVKHYDADRKSSIYSDRPRFVMVNELLAGGKFMAMMSYNDLYVLVDESA